MEPWPLSPPTLTHISCSGINPECQVSRPSLNNSTVNVAQCHVCGHLLLNSSVLKIFFSRLFTQTHGACWNTWPLLRSGNEKDIISPFDSTCEVCGQPPLLSLGSHGYIEGLQPTTRYCNVYTLYTVGVLFPLRMEDSKAIPWEGQFRLDGQALSSIQCHCHTCIPQQLLSVISGECLHLQT